MSVNLAKHKDALLAAWRDVLDNKTATNWALFGYEGMTNDLKFVSKGSNGIEEMTEDLNSGKIMFAFLQVTDPKTSLPKNVLINWQGEGAPNVRKGTCANHVRDVSNFFKGAHVTINARTEEEVDSSIIIDKVSKSTGSVYKFNERADSTNDAEPVPVVSKAHTSLDYNIKTQGTTYKRTIPKQEINSVERDRFWEKQEEEEKQRQETERRRVEEDRKKAEAERVLRDSQETAVREAKILEASKSINQMRLAEKVALERSQVAANVPVEDLEKEELERRNRADIMRRQRSEEAQTLIAKRTVDVRAIFEKNTAAGQLTQRRSSVQPKSADDGRIAQRRSSEAPQVVKNTQWENKPVTAAVVEVPKEEPVVVKNGVNGNQAKEDIEEEQQDWEDEVTHEIPVTKAPIEFQDPLISTEQIRNGDLGLTAKALYDYQAADETEITFDPGDLIVHIDQIDEGWWQGVGPDGTFGLFPANYVELIQ